MTEKSMETALTLTTPSGDKIAVLVEGLENEGNHKLVFLQHGWSGYKEQVMIRIPAQAFLDAGFVVITFDSRNSFGKSSGKLEDTTLTGFIADLTTVIDWASKQSFYSEPFALCGHSLGGGSILAYAEDYPKKVSYLIPISAMVGGKYFVRSRELNFAQAFAEWQKTGKIYREKVGSPSVNGCISYNTVIDMEKYDMVADGSKIKCPVLLITGNLDLSSTRDNNEEMFNSLKGEKKLVIVENCTHIFDNAQNQSDLYDAIQLWLSPKEED